MAATDKQFAGAIPEIYDRFLVPLIFAPYARDLAGRLVATEPRAVLEIAAGTGALTREIAARLPTDAKLTATDLNPPMLERAAARQTGDARIVWKQADALALPFGDGCFDAVACQFGAMFFPDKIQGYKEARRVLRPGGHFFFNVWDRIADNEFTAVVADALAALFPDDPPRFMERVPHGYHDAARIRAELAAAGFTNIAIETVTHTSRGTARDTAMALCQGTPWRSEIEARDPAGLDMATARAADALAKRFGTGAIEGRIQALVVAATA